VVSITHRLQARVRHHVPEQFARAGGARADDARRRPFLERAEDGQRAGAQADVHGAGDDRLESLAAAGRVEDVELEPMLLGDALLLAELRHAAFPAPALRRRDLEIGGLHAGNCHRGEEHGGAGLLQPGHGIVLLMHECQGISANVAATRSAKARVPSGPPRSAVRHSGRAITASSARSMRSAARASRSSPRRSPSQASSMAVEPMSDAGLAWSRPAMSGAEPCWACATACVAPALMDAASPRLPAISEASSERMSPNMLVVTITSNMPASRTSSAAMASMMRSS